MRRRGPSSPRIGSCLVWAGLGACACAPGPSQDVAPDPANAPAQRPEGGASSPSAPASGRWTPIPVPTTANFRGSSVAPDGSIWASGSAGTVVRSTDGGTWTVHRISEAPAVDFRDIQAFDATTAVVLAAGSPALVYRTSDAGATWTQTYRHDHPDVFFDAMDFWDDRRGVAMGDPIDGRFFLIVTDDGGQTWAELPPDQRPLAQGAEAGFAGSGTNLRVGPGGLAWFGTGGTTARIFRSTDFGRNWSPAETPLLASPASGVFSVAFDPTGKRGLAVGGNYRRETEAVANLAHSHDGGLTWRAPDPGVTLGGFREIVAFRPGTGGAQALALGPSGCDHTADGGLTWTTTDLTPNYHSLAFAPDGSAAWAVGANGALSRWDPS